MAPVYEKIRAKRSESNKTSRTRRTIELTPRPSTGQPRSTRREGMRRNVLWTAQALSTSTPSQDPTSQ